MLLHRLLWAAETVRRVMLGWVFPALAWVPETRCVGPAREKKRKRGRVGSSSPPNWEKCLCFLGRFFQVRDHESSFSSRDEVISRMVSRYLLDIYISQISEQAISTGSGLFSASRVELSSLLDWWVKHRLPDFHHLRKAMLMPLNPDLPSFRGGSSPPAGCWTGIGELLHATQGWCHLRKLNQNVEVRHAYL